MNLFRTLRGRAARRPAAAPTRRPTRPKIGLEALESREVPAGLLDPSQPYRNFLDSGRYAVGAGNPQLGAVGNFNSTFDNIPDLVTANADGSISVLLGSPRGGFGPPFGFINLPGPYGPLGPSSQFFPYGYSGAQLYGAVGPSPEGITVGDFNGDGADDVAVASYGYGNSPGGVTVLLNSGGFGLFYVAQHLGLNESPGLNNATTPGATYITSSDLTGDGRPDLVVSDFNNNHVLVYAGNGDGTFRLNDYNFTSNGVLNPNQLVVADLNGDGVKDVAVANKGNGSVSVFRGLGGGFITAAGNFPVLGARESIGLAAGDLDGDGRIDLAVASYTDSFNLNQHGTLAVLRNTGTGGGFGFQTAYVYGGIGRHLVNVVIGDFDRDGRNDLAVTAPGDPDAPENNMYVFYNNRPAAGRLSFAAPVSYYTNVGQNPIGLLAYDFNRDGKLDLLTVNEYDGTVSLFLRNR